MAPRKLSLFLKFLEVFKGIKSKKDPFIIGQLMHNYLLGEPNVRPYLFRFDKEVFAEYTSLLIGKTKIGLQ